MDSLSLEKQEIIASAGIIGSYSNHPSTIKEIKDELTKVEKKTKKEGFKNVFVRFGYRDGDENSLGDAFMEIIGTRLETNEEWHRRLECNRDRDKCQLDKLSDAARMSEVLYDEICKVDEALFKSPLKCKKCKKPTSNKQWDGRKWHLICYECHSRKD